MSKDLKHNELDSPAEALQLLTFLLDGEVYGTDIASIQEVLDYRRVTPVPRTPDFMLGVINLRGSVVPVMDLRQLFHMQVTENTVDTCIVIVDVTVDGENTSMGLLADAVREVIELSPEEVTPPPRIGSRIDTRYIHGMGKRDEEFIVILDLSAIFADDSLEGVLPAEGVTPDVPQHHALPTTAESA